MELLPSASWPNNYDTNRRPSRGPAHWPKCRRGYPTVPPLTILQDPLNFRSTNGLWGHPDSRVAHYLSDGHTKHKRTCPKEYHHVGAIRGTCQPNPPMES